MVSEMAGVSCYIRKIECTRANGLMMLGRVGALRDIKMAINTRVSSKMVRHMAKECTHGQMGRYMTVNGKME